MFDVHQINSDNFIGRLKARDEKALEYVIDSYGGMIQSIVHRRLSAFSEQWDDCENEILLAVWNEIGHFDPTKSSFKSWLAAVCRYKAIDCLRRSAKYQTELPFPADKENAPLADGPETACEVREAVQDLLKDLPEEEQKLFWDCYVRQESTEQLARDRKIRVSALYNRLSRGKKKLRQSHIREVKPL